MSRSYYLLTLGCPKNTVDAQGIGSLLATVGYSGVADPTLANVLIVNTCGFTAAATAESLEALRELAAQKQPHQLLIAAGCLAERCGPGLSDPVPVLDGILGTRRWMDILRLLNRAKRTRQHPVIICGPQHQVGASPAHMRRVAVQGSTAYLKIAEGCSASCAFCAIPAIKGPARSRPNADILDDTEQLIDQGVQEIILIAQDTTAYGLDRGERDGLPPLIERILKRTQQGGSHLQWLRLLYAYPQRISPRLIEVMASYPQVCHYLDLPLQHAHPDVLARMSRPADIGAVRRLIRGVRTAMPDVALRTSFIVGYPGETQGEFQALMDFMEEIQFDKVGIFTYSREEGTLAAELPEQLPESMKEARYRQLMELQQTISRACNHEMLEQTLDMLVEGYNEGLSVGRSYRDAPEIDGFIIVKEKLPLGKIVPVRIIEALEYDLVGVVESNATITPIC